MSATTAAESNKSPLVSSIISSVLSLLIFATLRNYADWFNSSEIKILVGGFAGSWLFLFSLTAVSNVESIVFGSDFQAKFVPEILSCLSLAVLAAGVVHRVCATTCILFSFVGIYFINRIALNYHNRNSPNGAVDAIPPRKTAKKQK